MPKLAAEMSVSPSQLALAWVLRRCEVSGAIMGASSVAQVEDNCAAAELTIPETILKELDALFPGPGETYPI